jgi:hypothetical protein
MQLGSRQARYIGWTKTLFQLALAATVANLTLLAGRAVAHPPQAGAVSGSSSAAAVLTVAVLVLLLALARQHSRVGTRAGPHRLLAAFKATLSHFSRIQVVRRSAISRS